MSGLFLNANQGFPTRGSERSLMGLLFPGEEQDNPGRGLEAGR